MGHFLGCDTSALEGQTINPRREPRSTPVKRYSVFALRSTIPKFDRLLRKAFLRRRHDIGRHLSGILINPNLVETFKIFFDAGYQAITANQESRSIHLQEVQQVAATGIDTLKTHNFVFRIAEQE